MAKFRIYNVQVLPGTVSQGDIGVSGYKKIFAEFREKTKAAYREKRLTSFHAEAGAKSFFGPQEFHVRAGYVWGYFVRYKSSEDLQNIYTRESVKKTRQIAQSVKDMLFVFDCRQHFLAIAEANGGLPENSDVERILKDYLSPIAAEFFPQHQLDVFLVADKKSLDQIFESAAGFGRIEIDLSFPNGTAEDTLDAMKQARINRFKASVSPATSGQIDRKIPQFLVDLMRGAMTYGKVRATYFTQSESKTGVEIRKNYDSDADPLTIEKHQGKEESDEDFVLRCRDELTQIVRVNNLSGQQIPLDTDDEE